MRVLYNLFPKKSNICSYIFRKNQEIFQSYAQYRREKGGTSNKNKPQPCNESPSAAMKKAIRKRVSADAFSRRAFLSLRVFLVPLVWERRFKFIVWAVAFRLFLGVSLSAAARSAAALVYDKLTPNCHLFLNVI